MFQVPGVNAGALSVSTKLPSTKMSNCRTPDVASVPDALKTIGPTRICPSETPINTGTLGGVASIVKLLLSVDTLPTRSATDAVIVCRPSGRFVAGVNVMNVGSFCGDTAAPSIFIVAVVLSTPLAASLYVI